MHKAMIAIVVALAMPSETYATTFADEVKVCPVGGEKFTFMAMMSNTTWGTLPDGMPLGTGPYPVPLAQCPTNGLVLFRDFDAAEIQKLSSIVHGDRYQSNRKTQTPYYLAYELATALGDEDSRPWLLLSATWEAKNANPISDIAQRYMNQFAALVASLPLVATDLSSIALKARAANTLRELERFQEADTLRASIVIDPTAGGKDDDAKQNRAGWQQFIHELAQPIARNDSQRAPIDMIGDRMAAERCIEPEGNNLPTPSAPLSSFEREYCARPNLRAPIAQLRKWRTER